MVELETNQLPVAYSPPVYTKEHIEHTVYLNVVRVRNATSDGMFTFRIYEFDNEQPMPKLSHISRQWP